MMSFFLFFGWIIYFDTIFGQSSWGINEESIGVPDLKAYNMKSSPKIRIADITAMTIMEFLIFIILNAQAQRRELPRSLMFFSASLSGGKGPESLLPKNPKSFVIFEEANTKHRPSTALIAGGNASG